MRTWNRIYLYALVALLSTACRSWSPESVNGSYYSLSDSLVADSATLTFINTYRLPLDSSMSEVIAILPADLKKERPNGNLGFWMADACRNYAQVSRGLNADVALLNSGGIRRPYIKAGEVKLGDMYELMPFDNQLVYLEVSGELLKRICELVVQKGGDPVSGVIIQKSESGLHIEINGEGLDPNKVYYVVSNDYMYNGGDGYGLLKEATSVEYLGLVRDALISGMRLGNVPVMPAEERRIFLD